MKNWWKKLSERNKKVIRYVIGGFLLGMLIITLIAYYN